MLSHTDKHIRLRNKSCQFERRGEGGCQKRMLSKQHTRKWNSVSQTEDKGCWNGKHQTLPGGHEHTQASEKNSDPIIKPEGKIRPWETSPESWNITALLNPVC